MWCIGELTAEYGRRMYDLLDLYARPHDPAEPMICLDKKSNRCGKLVDLAGEAGNRDQGGLRV